MWELGMRATLYSTWFLKQYQIRIEDLWIYASYSWRVPSALIGKRPKSQLPCLCNTAAWATGNPRVGIPQCMVVSRSKWSRNMFFFVCVYPILKQTCFFRIEKQILQFATQTFVLDQNKSRITFLSEGLINEKYTLLFSRSCTPKIETLIFHVNFQPACACAFTYEAHPNQRHLQEVFWSRFSAANNETPIHANHLSLSPVSIHAKP